MYVVLLYYIPICLLYYGVFQSKFTLITLNLKKATPSGGLQRRTENFATYLYALCTTESINQNLLSTLKQRQHLGDSRGESKILWCVCQTNKPVLYHYCTTTLLLLYCYRMTCMSNEQTWYFMTASILHYYYFTGIAWPDIGLVYQHMLLLLYYHFTTTLLLLYYNTH